MAFLINDQPVINNDRQLGTGLSSIWDVFTSQAQNRNTVNREYCRITAAGQTVNLPTTNLVSGMEVVVSVVNFTNTIVNPGPSNRIMWQPLGETMTIDIPYAAVHFIYIDSSQGWGVY